MPETCSFQGCGNKHHKANYCQRHYKQYYNGEELTPPHHSLKRKAPPGSPQDIRSLFYYDPLTGAFMRKDTGTMWGRGSYRPISIKKKKYPVHRIMYYMMTGEWPPEIDHIDNDPSNNKFENLRPATNKENIRNRRGWNKHGVKGIRYLDHIKTPRGKKWGAQVWIDGHNVSKMFHTIEEAQAWYEERVKARDGEFLNLDNQTRV